MPDEGTNIDLPMQQLNVTSCSLCGCEIDVTGMPPLTQIECPDCTSLETVPGKFGPFLIIGLIGTGGMGGVFKAKDETLGRLVAIKVVLPSVAANAEFLETFKREAQAAAKLNHPHIAQIYSFGQHAGQPYIVMELVDGKCFDKMFDADNPLDQLTVMKVGLEIAEGLQAADEIGLVHGDIKPENILLNEKKEAKLIDFGIASFAQKSAEDGIWGTPYYIAPEKIKRQKTDARSDIYCLGGALYHALTGRPPFDGATPVDVVKSRLTNDPEPPSKINSRVDNGVEHIIMRMLQREPSRRYPNYGSLIKDFKKAISTVRKKGGPRATVARNKKVVINKKRTSDVASAASSAASTSKKTKVNKTYKKSKTVTKQPSAMSQHLAEKKASEKTPAKKKGGAGKKFIMFLVIVLLLGCGAGAYYLYDQSQQKKKAKIAVYELGIRKTKASDILKDMGDRGKKIEKLAKSAKAIAATVSNSVFVVLNESMEYQLEPKSKDKKEKKDKSKAKKTAKGAKDKAEAKSTEEEPTEKKIEEKPEPERDPSLPVGVSAAHMRKLQRRAQGLPEEEEEEEAPPEPEEEVAPEVPEEQPEEAEPESSGDPEIKKRATDTIRIIQQLLNEVIKSRRTIDIAKEINEKISKAGSMAATIEPFKELRDELRILKEQHNNVKEKLTEAEAAAELVEDLEKIEIKRRKASEDAAAEEERLRLQREADARKRQELAERTAEQLARISALHDENVILVMEYKYKEVLEKIMPEQGSFDTPEGKKAFKNLSEKYMHLLRMKRMLVQHLNHYPFKWGWGMGTSSIDIIGATIEKINLKSRGVPWERTSKKQMLKIIKHYCDRKSYPTDSKKHTQQFTMPKLSADPNEPFVKASFIRVLGELNLAAAIFCVETGGAKGREIAEDYLRQATAYCTDLEDDVARLIGE